jgi:hypothetical protein
MSWLRRSASLAASDSRQRGPAPPTVIGACGTYLRSLLAPPIAHRFSGGFAVLPRQVPRGRQNRTSGHDCAVPRGTCQHPETIPPLKRWAMGRNGMKQARHASLDVLASTVRLAGSIRQSPARPSAADGHRSLWDLPAKPSGSANSPPLKRWAMGRNGMQQARHASLDVLASTVRLAGSIRRSPARPSAADGHRSLWDLPAKPSGSANSPPLQRWACGPPSTSPPGTAEPYLRPRLCRPPLDLPAPGDDPTAKAVGYWQKRRGVKTTRSSDCQSVLSRGPD